MPGNPINAYYKSSVFRCREGLRILQYCDRNIFTSLESSCCCKFTIIDLSDNFWEKDNEEKESLLCIHGCGHRIFSIPTFLRSAGSRTRAIIFQKLLLVDFFLGVSRISSKLSLFHNIFFFFYSSSLK